LWLAAGWLAKCGPLVSSLELQLIPKGVCWRDLPIASQRSQAELAIAAALETAAAAAAGGLRICSCKLAHAGLDIGAVLQALPASSLTSLDVELDLVPCIHENGAAAEIQALMTELSTVLPSLQQLLQLRLQYFDFDDRGAAFAPVVSGFGALTNLTHLELSMVSDMQCLSCRRGGSSYAVLTACMPWWYSRHVVYCSRISALPCRVQLH
jgi:hypothetical protein